LCFLLWWSQHSVQNLTVDGSVSHSEAVVRIMIAGMVYTAGVNLVIQNAEQDVTVLLVSMTLRGMCMKGLFSSMVAAITSKWTTLM
jgi:hypothetical protein